MPLSGIGFVLLAAVLLGAYAVYDKVVVFRHVQDARFLTYTSRILICLLVAPALLLPGVTVPAPQVTAVALAAGLLYIASALIYFTGVRTGDPSTMIVFLNTKPALVVLAAAALLGELLAPVQYVGIAAVVGATLLLSISRIDGRLQLRTTARYGAAFAAVVAAIDVVSKYVVTRSSPAAFLALAGIGMGVGGAVGLAHRYRTAPDTVTANMTRPALRAIATRTLLWVAGLTAFFTSLSTVPVSIAASLVATQTAVTVLGVWLLVRLGRADVAVGDVAFRTKFLAAAGIVLGVTLVSRPPLPL